MNKPTKPKLQAIDDYRHTGLLKYDCPTASCSAWFVTFDPLDVRCEACGERMIDTQVL